MIKLAEMLTNAARQTICSYDELLEIATWWLVTLSEGQDGFDTVLETYTTLRGRGYSPSEAKKYISAVHVVGGIMGRDKKVKKVVNRPTTRLIRDE